MIIYSSAQHYSNCPAPCHNTIRKGLDHLDVPLTTALVHCIGDLLSRSNEQKWQVCWKSL